MPLHYAAPMRFDASGIRRPSSVVEHTLGKGEVVGSNPMGGFARRIALQMRLSAFFESSNMTVFDGRRRSASAGYGPFGPTPDQISAKTNPANPVYIDHYAETY